MRLFIVSMLAAASVAGTASAQTAEPTTPVRKVAEDCLRTRAPEAVAASSGAADAAVFLLDYLCASPVAAAGLYERNAKTLATLYEMFAATGEGTEDLDGLSVDPVTGEMKSRGGKKDEEAMAAMLGMSMLGSMGMFNGGDTGGGAPLYLREFAGRLILQHRATPQQTVP